MRPGCSSARVPNCSAITSGEWLGSMTPPEPRRIESVCAATCAMSTAVAEEAMEGMLWCSAYQTRRKPAASATRACSTDSAKASPIGAPSRTRARSSRDSGRGVGAVCSVMVLLVCGPPGQAEVSTDPAPTGPGLFRGRARRRPPASGVGDERPSSGPRRADQTE